MKPRIDLGVTEADRPALREQAHLGQQAEDILTNPAFAAAARQAEDLFIQQWKNSELEATKLREMAYMKIQALDEVLNQLAAITHSGRNAKAILEHLDRREAQTQ